jgi:YidC/Oxa1 family membrane protein insertase
MWDTIFYEPIVNLLLVLYKFVGENLGLAIIAVVLLLRLVLFPLTQLQMKSSKKMQEMQPKLKKLQGKNNKDMTMAEMAAVKDMGKGCAYGCLPTLVQLPFLISLYKAIKVLASSAGTVFNPIAYGTYLMFTEGYNFNTYFLGLDLAVIPSEIGFKNSAIIPYLVLVVLVGASQWATTKVMAMQRGEDKNKKKKEDEKAKQKKDKKKKKKSEQEMQSEMMSATNNYMQIMFPAMLAFAAFSVPAALSVYWFVQSLFLVAQVGVTMFLEKRKQEKEPQKAKKKSKK